MSTTIEPATDDATQIAAPAAPPERRNPAATSGSGWLLPLVTVAAWVGLVSLVFAVAPPPDPDAPVDMLSVVLSEVFWFSALGTLAALVTRSRWAYGLTAVGGVTLAAGAVVCFAGGHTGAWIAVQALAGVGLATVGGASLRATS